jgi:hypothetical protein
MIGFKVDEEPLLRACSLASVAGSPVISRGAGSRPRVDSLRGRASAGAKAGARSVRAPSFSPRPHSKFCGVGPLRLFFWTRGLPRRADLRRLGEVLQDTACLDGRAKNSDKMNAQRFGDAIEEINCRIFRLPLKTGHVRAVHPGLVSQSLLGNTAFRPNPTHIPSH